MKLQVDTAKKNLLRKLIQRVEQCINNTFLTAEMSPKKHDKTIREEIIQTQREKSSVHKSHSVGKMKINSSRVEMAILQADEKMQDYIASMKNSFVLDNQ